MLHRCPVVAGSPDLNDTTAAQTGALGGRRGLHVRGQRTMCSQPREGGVKSQVHTPEPAAQTRPGFRIPGYQPSELDKKILVWSGRFKSKDQIPETVSFEMIDGARNRARVKVCYAMMFLTIISCLGMVILGKQAAGRHESLTTWNMEKKARWREEALREKEAAATAASGKV